MKTEIQPVLLRIEEAAERLALSRSLINQMIRSGELPVIKIGKLVRLSVASLDAWVASKTQTTKTEESPVC